MTRAELGDDQVKADLMSKLSRRRCWGANYLPLDTLVRWYSKRVSNDGNRIKRIVKELIEDGYVIPQKGGQTISLNSHKKKEIEEFIERYLGA